MAKKSLNDMYDDNVCVLLLAILSEKEITVEEAFEIYERGSLNKKSKQKTLKYKTTLTDDDIKDMIILKEKRGYSLSEIGKIYNMNKQAVHKRIKRYMTKQNLIA